MELKDFVAETLKQILDGVVMAQKYATNIGAVVNPANVFPAGDGSSSLKSRDRGYVIQMIEFDVVVTTTDSDRAKGGVGIFIGALGTGIQGEEEQSKSRQDRIRFSVPLQLPSQ
jgi:hypothetical protein